jgi:hypothetical protein
MGSDNVTNYASSTLTAGISAGATSFTVAAGTGAAFPSPTNLNNANSFIVSIDAELILCSARTADTFTVASGGRGYDGTSAASHLSGATVTHGMTAGMLKHVWQNVPDNWNIDVPPYQRAGFAALGSPDTASDEFEATTGAGWTIFPIDAGGTFTFNTSIKSCMTFSRATNNSTSYHFYKAFSSAAGSWGITCRLSHGYSPNGWGNTNFIQATLFVSDAANPTSLDTSNSVRIGSIYNNTTVSVTTGGVAGAVNTRLIKASNSLASGEVGTVYITPDTSLYLRIRNGGTNHWAAEVGDGFTWRRVASYTAAPLGTAVQSMGIRFSANTSFASGEVVAVDWIRYETGTGTF